MKTIIICLLLPLVLFGCLKKQAETTHQPQQLQNQQNTPTAVLPFQITIVETIETKEIRDITNQANILFQAKDYDGLDAFARKLRNSKERYANGSWKFYFVYVGLNLSEKAPDAEWAAHLAALHDWINAKPNSITARVALANDLVSYAWKARGSDWADKVTDEGWSLFDQRLNEAFQVLNEAKPLNEQCPFWWSVMLQTELGLCRERAEYDATFEEATRAWPDYSPYYCRRAWYLLPRWSGTEGEWESDLEKSADRIGGEEGDLLYARTVWSMHQSRLFTNIFEESHPVQLLNIPRTKAPKKSNERMIVPFSSAGKTPTTNAALFSRWHLLGQVRQVVGDDIAVLGGGAHQPWQKEAYSYLGIDDSSCEAIGGYQCIRVRHLFLFANVWNFNAGGWICRYLREAFRDIPPASQERRQIFVSRLGARRQVVNELVLHDIARRYGFEIVNPGSLSV